MNKYVLGLAIVTALSVPVLATDRPDTEPHNHSSFTDLNLATTKKKDAVIKSARVKQTDAHSLSLQLAANAAVTTMKKKEVVIEYRPVKSN